MLRHVALFRFKPETTDEQISAAMGALSALPGQIDVLRKFRFGPDAGITDGAWDFRGGSRARRRRRLCRVPRPSGARVQFESEGDSTPRTQGS